MDDQAQKQYDTWKDELDAERRNAPKEESVKKTESQKPRISIFTGIAMLLVALAVDGGQILLSSILIGLILNSIIDIFTWLTFFIWFKSLGISFGLKGWGKMGSGGSESPFKNPLFSIFIAFVVEFIPGWNNIPAWTAAIIVIIFIEYASYLLKKFGMVKSLLKLAA